MVTKSLLQLCWRVATEVTKCHVVLGKQRLMGRDAEDNDGVGVGTRKYLLAKELFYVVDMFDHVEQNHCIKLLRWQMC